MQAGTLITSGVAAHTSRVLVQGVQRSVLSWSVSRELSGDLPEQVVGGSGITQATGSIDWAPTGSMDRGGLNPWNKATGWLPRRGDRVEIFAGDGATEWKQFEGVVDTSSGSVRGGVSSTIIDRFDKLSATISHAPMLRRMPPREGGGLYRGVGLAGSYYANAAMRQAGFFSTPRTEANAVLSVPCQGSTWPDMGIYGTLDAGIGKDTGYYHAQNFPAPWGWAVGNFVNTYIPRYSNTPTLPLQMTVMVAPNHFGNFTMNAHYGTATIGLAIWGERYPAAYINGVRVALISSAQFQTATMVTLLYKGGAVELRADNGVGATATAPIGTSAPMEKIVIDADASVRVAGIQASHPSSVAQEFASLSFVPSAVLDMSKDDFNNLMDAGPRIENRRIDDLLDEIGRATLSAMWIDELGVLRWVPSLALRSRPSAQTVTTAASIFELDWEESSLGSRSKVTVKGQNPSISKSRWNSIKLYEGSGASLESEDVLEEIVGPDDDEDWIMPDESMAILGPDNWGTYNSGRGTYGGVFYTASGETTSDVGLSAQISMDRQGITRYKITHTAGTFPSDVTANLGTSPTSSALWERNRDKPLPIIKGAGKVEWQDVEAVPITAGGDGPELVHDAGLWNNRADTIEPLQLMANYIASSTAVPLPTISGLRLTFDPRRQLGDVITIASPSLMGVTLKALVVGVDSSASTSGLTQSLRVQVISATSTFTTHAEWEAAFGDTLTYSQWHALRSATDTWADFNNTPLKGA